MFDKDNDQSTEVQNVNEKAQTPKDQVSEIELLKDMVRKENKQLFYTRIACLALIVFTAAVIIVFFILVPQVEATLDEVNTAVASAEEILDQGKSTLNDIEGMTGDISEAAESVNRLVIDNEEVLNDSMSKIGDIDFEGLNEAIKDLQDVVEPMANFMNKFR